MRALLPLFVTLLFAASIVCNFITGFPFDLPDQPGTTLIVILLAATFFLWVRLIITADPVKAYQSSEFDLDEDDEDDDLELESITDEWLKNQEKEIADLRSVIDKIKVDYQDHNHELIEKNDELSRRLVTVINQASEDQAAHEAKVTELTNNVNQLSEMNKRLHAELDKYQVNL